MQEAIAIAEAHGKGLIRSRHLAQLGISSDRLAEAVGLGVLYRVRRGYYARPMPFPRDRHKLLVRAVDDAGGSRMIVSHLSAAAMHDLPIIGPWPDRVHTLAPGRGGGSSRADVFAHAVADEPEYVLVDGVMVTTLERTLADVASTAGLEVAVTMIHYALRTRRVERSHVEAEARQRRARYGGSRALTAIMFADPRAASPGESLSRVRMHQLAFEAPELQVEVRIGRQRYDVDFGWASTALFGEFDGLIKYTRAAELSGLPVEEVVVAEKVREDAIRAETDRRFTRWLWKEALNAAAFARKLRDAGVPNARRAGSTSRRTF